MPRKRFPTLSVRVSLFVVILLIGPRLVFGQAETILHNFIALPHGAQPEAGLVADGAGNLYGTTFNGGQYGVGTVVNHQDAERLGGASIHRRTLR